MILGTPFWFCLLPILILVVPMKRIWSKARNRILWRSVSITWLSVSILIAAGIALTTEIIVDGTVLRSFPMRYPVDPIFGDNQFMTGWIKGVNISLMVGIFTLPLTVASYIETRLAPNK